VVRVERNNMAVPEYKRNQSNIQFLDTFHKLRKNTTFILMRDFGIKPRTYTVELLDEIYEISEDDKKTLHELMSKYGMNSSEIEKYPKWLIDSWRKEIRWILKMIGTEIEIANSIYINEATAEEDYQKRKQHWELAIGYCNALKDSLNEIIDTVKVKIGAYTDVTQMIEKEISLLKGVRKSDRKRKEELIEKRNT